jgi:pyruvate/2-oxoglutarate/acetoin dehydrogenase E1 component
VVRSGDAVTVVTWGTGRALVEEALASDSVAVDLIDLRWLSPWDRDTVLASARRTGRLLVVHEANVTGGFGAEVVATVAGELGSDLRGSARVGLLGTPVPAAPALAEAVLPTSAQILRAINSLLEV